MLVRRLSGGSSTELGSQGANPLRRFLPLGWRGITTPAPMRPQPIRHHLPDRRKRGVRWRQGSPFPSTEVLDRKSTRLNSSHVEISYAVFCLKKKREGHGRSDSEEQG